MAAENIKPIEVAPETAKEVEELSRILQLANAQVASAQAQADAALARAAGIRDQRDALLRSASRELDVPNGWSYRPDMAAFAPQAPAQPHSHEH